MSEILTQSIQDYLKQIYDLSADGAAALARTTKRIAEAVRKVTGAPGVMLAQLNGSAAGQTVFHIHFHVIPRSSGIDLALHAREKADFTKLKALAEKIAAAVQ